MSSRVPLWLTALLAVAALAVGVVLSPLTDREPGETSAEAGFARDMSAHHAQAVAMSAMAFDRTDDPDVRAVALDIATSQQAQIGAMSAWLQEWGLPQRSRTPAMAWMDPVDGTEHAEHADGLMPGMATRQEMQQLAAARGPEFDALWARLMHAHHRGGLPMTEQVIAKSDREPVVLLATSMRDSQSAELAVLEDIAARAGGSVDDAQTHGDAHAAH